MSDIELAVAKGIELVLERQATEATKKAEFEAAEKLAAEKAVEDFKTEIEYDEETWKSKKGSVNVMENAELGSEGDEGPTEAFNYWMRTGDEVVARKALQEGTGSEGGFLVPSPIDTGIVELRDELSFVRAMGVQVFQTSALTLDIPAESAAAPIFTRTAEEAAFASDDPAFNQNAVTAHKWTTAVLIANELLEDANSNVEAYYQRWVARGMAATENKFVAIGTGTNQHEGIFTGGDTDGLVFAGSDAITADEIPELLFKLGSGYQQGAAWLMDPDTFRYIISIFSTSQFAFDAMAGSVVIGGDGPQAGTILGKPVYLQDDIPVRSAGLGVIAIGNPDFYALVERRGLTVLRDPYTKASSGQVVFHVSFRQGGKVLVENAWKIGQQGA